MVADYLRIPVPDVDGLDLVYYLRIRRDAFIDALNGSEAWRLTRTEPDRKASRELFGKGEC